MVKRFVVLLDLVYATLLFPTLRCGSFNYRCWICLSTLEQQATDGDRSFWVAAFGADGTTQHSVYHPLV